MGFCPPRLVLVCILARRHVVCGVDRLRSGEWRAGSPLRMPFTITSVPYVQYGVWAHSRPDRTGVKSCVGCGSTWPQGIRVEAL